MEIEAITDLVLVSGYTFTFIIALPLPWTFSEFKNVRLQGRVNPAHVFCLRVCILSN